MWNPFKRSNQPVPAPVLSVDFQLKQITEAVKKGIQIAPSWTIGKSRGRSDWDFRTAVVEGYTASTIVYACVEKRAQLVASVPWKAARKVNGEIEFEPNSKLQALLDDPNDDESFYELIYNAQQATDLNGQAYIYSMLAGTDNVPVELRYLPPEGMKITPNKFRAAESYEYHKQTVDKEEMVVLKKPNPRDPLFGMPVLMAAGRPTDVDREAGIWQKTSLENRGASDLNIKLPDGATQEQVNNVKKQYKEQQAGAKNARKTMVTNAEIQQLGQNAVELDFVASRRSTWTEIAAAFGMSLANLGMTESVNLANADAMDKQLWKNTIIPQLELFKRQFDRQLAKAFGPEWVMVPDLTNIAALQDNRNEVLDAATKLFAMGVPFDQINQTLELGLEEFEGSDVGYIPTGLIPSSFNNLDDDNEETDNSDEALGNAAEEAFGLPLDTGTDVQGSALNGAQVNSLTEIVGQVARGELPVESAILLIIAAFPSLTEAEARDMVSPAEDYNLSRTGDGVPNSDRE